jgi:hypothetical protein
MRAANPLSAVKATKADLPKRRGAVMHDINSTALEMEGESFEYEFETDGEWNEVLQEGELNELASGLLEVSNDQELDQFLGGLISKIAQKAKRFVTGPLGKQLGRAFKSLAKRALPIVANTLIPGSGVVAAAAGEALGLELEGLSPEDREFEVAKQVVRLAADATKTALTAPAHANPAQVASAVLQQSMRKHAPHMVQVRQGPSTQGLPSSGTWVRKGRHIIITLGG